MVTRLVRLCFFCLNAFAGPYTVKFVVDRITFESVQVVTDGKDEAWTDWLHKQQVLESCFVLSSLV